MKFFAAVDNVTTSYFRKDKYFTGYLQGEHKL